MRKDGRNPEQSSPKLVRVLAGIVLALLLMSPLLHPRELIGIPPTLYGLASFLSALLLGSFLAQIGGPSQTGLIFSKQGASPSRPTTKYDHCSHLED